MGHPDTLSDMIADEFNRLYLDYCLANYGATLNHAVDKTTLVGASSRSWFGGYEIMKPISVHFFGKITHKVNDSIIPIEYIAQNAVKNILSAATKNTDILNYININIENGAGYQPDHSSNFYHANNDSNGLNMGYESLANDTIIAVGTSQKHSAGRQLIQIENSIFNILPSNIIDIIGTDIKMAMFGNSDKVNLTICIPIHPEKISSLNEYKSVKEEIKNLLENYLLTVQDNIKVKNIELSINTKDLGNGTYIAPFGTALGKGDCGAVGRGNKLNGYIDYINPSSIEAPAGKNPLNHVGKIYQYLSQFIADELVLKYGVESSTVTLFTQNGRPLQDPYSISIEYLSDKEIDIAMIKQHIVDLLDNTPFFWKSFIHKSVIDRYKTNPASVY